MYNNLKITSIDSGLSNIIIASNFFSNDCESINSFNHFISIININNVLLCI